MYWNPTRHEGKVNNTLATQMKSSEDQGEQYCAKGRKGGKEIIKRDKRKL